MDNQLHPEDHKQLSKKLLVNIIQNMKTYHGLVYRPALASHIVECPNITEAIGLRTTRKFIEIPNLETRQRIINDIPKLMKDFEDEGCIESFGCPIQKIEMDEASHEKLREISRTVIEEADRMEWGFQYISGEITLEEYRDRINKQGEYSGKSITS